MSSAQRRQITVSESTKPLVEKRFIRWQILSDKQCRNSSKLEIGKYLASKFKEALRALRFRKIDNIPAPLTLEAIAGSSLEKPSSIVVVLFWCNLTRRRPKSSNDKKENENMFSKLFLLDTLKKNGKTFSSTSKQNIRQYIRTSGSL